LSVCVCVCVSDKESGERLSRLVEEACMLLADYSGRLAAEIDDRRQLTRTLAIFLQTQRDGLAQNEQKLEVGKLTDIISFPFLFTLHCCLLLTSVIYFLVFLQLLVFETCVCQKYMKIFTTCTKLKFNFILHCDQSCIGLFCL